MTTQANSDVPHAAGVARYIPILSIGLLFFIFGFITWLNGALIPFLQMVCELSEIQALLIAFCFYIAYVVMALPMAKILEKTGYQKGYFFVACLIACFFVWVFVVCSCGAKRHVPYLSISAVCGWQWFNYSANGI